MCSWKSVIKECNSDLQQLLNLKCLSPALFAEGLLTDQEQQELANEASVPCKQNSHFIQTILPYKGEQSFNKFLTVLKNDDQHSGHKELFERLARCYAAARIHSLTPGNEDDSEHLTITTRQLKLVLEELIKDAVRVQCKEMIMVQKKHEEQEQRRHKALMNLINILINQQRNNSGVDADDPDQRRISVLSNTTSLTVSSAVGSCYSADGEESDTLSIYFGEYPSPAEDAKPTASRLCSPEDEQPLFPELITGRPRAKSLTSSKTIRAHLSASRSYSSSNVNNRFNEVLKLPNNSRVVHPDQGHTHSLSLPRKTHNSRLKENQLSRKRGPSSLVQESKFSGSSKMSQEENISSNRLPEEMSVSCTTADPTDSCNVSTTIFVHKQSEVVDSSLSGNINYGSSMVTLNIQNATDDDNNDDDDDDVDHNDDDVDHDDDDHNDDVDHDDAADHNDDNVDVEDDHNDDNVDHDVDDDDDDDDDVDFVTKEPDATMTNKGSSDMKHEVANSSSSPYASEDPRLPMPSTYCLNEKDTSDVLHPDSPVKKKPISVSCQFTIGDPTKQQQVYCPEKDGKVYFISWVDKQAKCRKISKLGAQHDAVITYDPSTNTMSPQQFICCRSNMTYAFGILNFKNRIVLVAGDNPKFLDGSVYLYQLAECKKYQRAFSYKWNEMAKSVRSCSPVVASPTHAVCTTTDNRIMVCQLSNNSDNTLKALSINIYNEACIEEDTKWKVLSLNLPTTLLNKVGHLTSGTVHQENLYLSIKTSEWFGVMRVSIADFDHLEIPAGLVANTLAFHGIMEEPSLTQYFLLGCSDDKLLASSVCKHNSFCSIGSITIANSLVKQTGCIVHQAPVDHEDAQLHSVISVPNCAMLILVYYIPHLQSYILNSVSSSVF